MSDPARRRALAGLAALAASSSLGATALEHPSHPVRIVVPYPPGGFNDRLARLLARRVGESWRTSVTVENRPGGGTLVATEAVARAEPDGRTLLLAGFAFAASPGLRASLPFDPLEDFDPVVLCASTPNLLVVGADQPYGDVADLIAAARARPSSIAFGSEGPASSAHLCIEMLEREAGIELTHVPYKGSATALADVVSGQIQAAFDDVPNVLPHLAAGRLRALAVTTASHFALLPHVPPMTETIRDFVVSSWFGLVAPHGTPHAFTDALNQEVNRILQLPRTRKQFAAEGVEAIGGSPERFAEHVRTEIARWRQIAKRAGLSSR
ncbi:MAG: tripartite tricarboxylate transporter substrate binding protein [Betaproteobacteria bacterium]|nr:tripartite tricarboxylate transporter substrate binding protein [Betaproteobacteria bacterium]